MREILGVLAPRPGDVAVDCTLGFGGHAQELLAAVQPGGRLLGIDADPIELKKAEARLFALGFPADALIVRRMNFAGVARFLSEVAPEGADLLLADLGLSSMQIDDPSRGFTFKVDGPLDMRMNPNRGHTAAELLSTVDEPSLARLLAENADEPDAGRLASAILLAQKNTPITTTASLAAVVRDTVAERLGHPHLRQTTPYGASSRPCESRSTTNRGRSPRSCEAFQHASSREAESPSSHSIPARTAW